MTPYQHLCTKHGVPEDTLWIFARPGGSAYNGHIVVVEDTGNNVVKLTSVFPGHSHRLLLYVGGCDEQNAACIIPLEQEVTSG